MGKLELISNKRTSWEGLWWHPESGYFSSAAINLADLRKFKGIVRLYVRKNRAFEKGTNRPNYVFSIMDANSESAYDLEIEDVDVGEEQEEERTYTREEVERVMHGACRDGQQGYSPYDLLVEDYV